MKYINADHEIIRNIEAQLIILRRNHPFNADVNVHLTASLRDLDLADRIIQWRIDND